MVERVNLNKLVPKKYRQIVSHVLNESYDEYVLKGGRGSLKSSIASLLAVLNVATGRGNSVCIRRYKTSLRGSCYTDVLVAIDRLGLSREFVAKVSPLEVVHTSGLSISFRGLDDPQKIKSLKAKVGEFTYLWFEECQEIEGYSKCRSVIQTVARGNQHTNIVYCFNPPSSGQSWVNKDLGVVEECHDRKVVLHINYLDVPSSWLGRQFILMAERLKERDYDTYRNEYLGEAAGSVGMIFKNVRPLKSLDGVDLSSVYRGLDFGFTNDPSSYVAWYYDRSTHSIYLKGSFYKRGLSIKRISEEIREENVHGFCVKCDSAEPRSISGLYERGIDAMACTKGADSVRHGIKWLQGLNGIYIDSDLDVDVYKEFSQYEYPRDKNGEYISEYPDKDNHSIDATRYALEDLIRGYI